MKTQAENERLEKEWTYWRNQVRQYPNNQACRTALQATLDVINGKKDYHEAR